MTVKTERRINSRKRPLSLVYVELPPSNGGMMRDLSEHGFSLRAMMPVQVSEKLPFTFSLDSAARIDGEAIVVRISDGGHVAALEFAGLPAHSRDQIHRWLKKFDEPIARETPPVKPTAPPESTLAQLREEARSVPARPVASPAPRVEPAGHEVLNPAPPPQPVAPAPQEPAQHEEVQQSVPQPPIAAEPSIPALRLPTQLDTPPPTPHPHELPAPPPQTEIVTEQPAHASFQEPEPPKPEPSVWQTPLPEERPQQLPPLLKLSSVRPAAPPEVPAQPILPVAHADQAPPQPPLVPIQEVLIQPPSHAAPQSAPAVHARPPAPYHRMPPPLEPLSSLETERDEESSGWMEGFTLRRAIGIMLLITLLVGSYVYHREFGHALIWLGQQIAGDEPSGTSQIVQPSLPPAPAASSEPAPVSTEAKTPIPAPPAVASAENKNVEPSPAAENPPAAAVPPASASATPAPEISAPATSPSDDGQQEYQEASKILHAPNRKAEMPEAIRLLWASVKKGNVGAEITLAELYHIGRGVPKSCAQTKVLLSAAARKGSPDAQARLKEFQRERCRD